MADILIALSALGWVALVIFVVRRYVKGQRGGVVKTDSYTSAYQDALNRNIPMWRLGAPVRPVGEELLCLVREIYNWTSYKDSPWGNRAKAAIEKAEKARGDA